MSGFFASLLSRSRGTADVVRPRLGSLFEPGAQRPSQEPGASPADAHAMAPAGLAPSIVSPAQGLALSRDTGSSHAAPHPRHGHDSPSHADRHLVTDADTDAWIGTHRRGEDWDAGDEAHAFAGGTRPSARADGATARGRRHRGDRGGRADQADGTAAAAPAGVSTVSAAGSGGVSASVPGAGAVSASAMRAALAQALATGGAAGVSNGSHGSSGSHHDAAAWDASLAAGTMPTAALVAAARPPASLASMPIPPSSRLQGDTSASRSRAEAAAAEPVIEISIGRIDVRATVDRGAERKAPATSSSVMGLDEYLQTRARARGGSR